ncbi:TR10B factor, partial [Rhinopomastus cyanomelas]|nr:TR10B factor [Rhinopomastus cyanomelas]
CSPCNKTEYTEYPNDFSKCMGCWVCREDQVELSPCQADRNTQCACRNGTFCSPDHPCEMCQKCRPQCPPGQVELAPCTQHSDRRCGPPASTSSSLSYGWIVVIVVAVVVLLVICLYVVKRFCCRSPGAGASLSLLGPPDLACASLLPQVQQLIRGCRVGEGTQDNNLNEQIVQAKLLPSSATCSAQGPEVPEPVPLLHPSGLAEETVPSPLQTLVPVPGEDPLKSLKAAFYVFYDHVYVDHWKTFGRALDLLDNDIEIILRKGYTKDSFFEMLSLWLSRQGMSASVNVLLSTLLDMRLRGTADIVSAELVQKKLFQYQVS